jgi:hypothetical protein
MSENVRASTSRNPKGLHGLYRDNFTLPYEDEFSTFGFETGKVIGKYCQVCHMWTTFKGPEEGSCKHGRNFIRIVIAYADFAACH